jgi:hypothetical protein
MLYQVAKREVAQRRAPKIGLRLITGKGAGALPGEWCTHCSGMNLRRGKAARKRHVNQVRQPLVSAFPN